MHVHLQTERLILRRFTEDDGSLLFELDNDPDVMRFINGGAPVAREEIDSDILPALLAYYERGDAYGFWAAVSRHDQHFLGWLHFRPHEGAPTSEPELGYRLHRFAWGHGYATEAARALIDDGFAGDIVQRVVAETMVVNVASRRVMEKAGLRYVRTFHADWPVRIPGDEEGDVEYAITRAEWEADRTARDVTGRAGTS